MCVPQAGLCKNTARKNDPKIFPKEKQVKSINGAHWIINVPSSGSDGQGLMRRSEDQSERTQRSIYCGIRDVKEQAVKTAHYVADINSSQY